MTAVKITSFTMCCQIGHHSTIQRMIIRTDFTYKYVIPVLVTQSWEARYEYRLALKMVVGKIGSRRVMS